MGSAPDSAGQQWRAHLELGGVKTSVAFPPTAGFSGVPERDAVVRALAEADGSSAVAQQRVEATVWTAVVGTKVVQLDGASTNVFIRDERGVGSGAAPFTDVQAYLKAAPVLDALGVRADESDWRVAFLSSRSRDEAGVEAPPQQLATKLFVDRVLGGLRVAEDRLVVTFAEDGSIRMIKGTWHPVDLGKSQLVATRVKDEIGELAIATLEQEARRRKFHPQLRAFRVSTFLEPEAIGSGLFRLVVAGQVDVPMSSPDGGERTTRFTFGL